MVFESWACYAGCNCLVCVHRTALACFVVVGEGKVCRRTLSVSGHTYLSLRAANLMDMGSGSGRADS